MRTSLIAASAALALVLPATLAPARAQAPEAPAAQGPGSEGATAPMVRNIAIIDLSELPAEARPQIEEAAAKAKKEDLDGLRQAVDGSPEIKKLLEVKGATSAEIVVANLDQAGTLTLFTRKRA
jgi:hypothetical protein